jgi:hypothetical protein
MVRLFFSQFVFEDDNKKAAPPEFDNISVGVL